MQDAINVKEYKTKYMCDTNVHSILAKHRDNYFLNAL